MFWVLDVIQTILSVTICTLWFAIGYTLGVKQKKDNSISDDKFAIRIGDMVEARAERELSFDERSKLENTILIIVSKDGQAQVRKRRHNRYRRFQSKEKSEE